MTVDELIESKGLVGMLEFAADVLRHLAQEFPTWSLTEADVARAVGRAQEIKELGQTVTAVLAREAAERSLGSDLGLSRPDWLKAQAPGLDGPGAAALTLLGSAMNDPRWAALADKVRSGLATVAQATVVLRLHKDVARVADPESLDAIIDAMVDTIELLTVAELTRLATQARAALKPPADAESEAERARMGRSFSKTGKTAGLNEYRLRLDPEGAAIIDAAIDPLARPRPDLAWTGDTKDDPRTAGCRRADALLELIGRAVAAPEGQTRTPRCKVVITMTLESLLEKLRGSGVADNGEVIPTETVRRMCCEASIIPTVMGGPSRVLDLGYSERYFTAAQRIVLAARDKGCSFPGCTVPPQWCEAHHCQHWLDGGRTDIDNGALLCGRHHTVVHNKGMTAMVTPDAVTWLLNGFPVRVTPRHEPAGGTDRDAGDQAARTRADLWARRTPAPTEAPPHPGWPSCGDDKPPPVWPPPGLRTPSPIPA